MPSARGRLVDRAEDEGSRSGEAPGGPPKMLASVVVASKGVRDPDGSP